MTTNSTWQQLKRAIPHWGRIVMNRHIQAFVVKLPVERLDAVEISGWAHGGNAWRSYRTLDYPAFDLCTREPLSPVADVLFCEQVLEHVPDPVQATNNIASLLRPGGYAIVNVPFMVRIHNEPGDYWRFTSAGLRMLLQRSGLEIVEEGDWGNRASVVANLWFWMPYVPFLQPMGRRADVPLVVWAIARRPLRKE